LLKEESNYMSDGLLCLTHYNIVYMTPREEELSKKLLELKDKLSKCEIQKERLIYRLSHDLKQPITAIVGYVDLFQRKYQGSLDEKAFAYLQNILVSAQKLSRYFDRLSMYPGVGKMEELEIIQPETILSELSEKLHPLIEATEASITWDELPEIRARKLDLKILFEELVRNAIYYRDTQNPPLVHISGSENTQYVEYEFADRGTGIDKKYHKEIFELLTRYNNSSDYSGCGVGLALCEKIVRAYQGDIGLNSKPGEGAVFILKLKKKINGLHDDK